MAALGALVVATGCADNADRRPGVADPAFYELPDPVPGAAPGDIVRVESVEGLGGEGKLLRVLYRSQSLAGAPIVVSGVVAVPPGVPPAGGWPVLSLAHGTVGLGDRCAPSRDPGPQAAEVAARGFVVVATDYEGLGPPGPHPYLVGESEARGVIDAVRAARALGDEVGAGTRYVVIGYSQGGHAALFANQIAATWAPELTLVGTVAGAPVVELAAWLAQLDARGDDWLQAMLVAGFAAADPAADPALVLTPDALERLDVVEEGCAQDVVQAYEGVTSLAAGLDTVPAFARLVAADTPGLVAGTGPLLVLGGDADPLIPPSLLDAGIARLCAAGQTVDRSVYAGVDHDGIILASLVDAVLWAQDRFAGRPARDGC